MSNKRRIWIDQDSVIYNLSGPWYYAHNQEHEHQIEEKDVNVWNTADVCTRNNCAADIYSYFNRSELWTEGEVLGYSDKITQQWQHDFPGIELGILTTTPNSTAATLKMEWIAKYFPHIKDIVIVNGHLKHLIRGDILIDDGIHNLTKWKGIGILYSQPWNYSTHRLRAHVANDNIHKHVPQWSEVDRIVRKSLSLLNQGFSHKVAEAILASQQNIGL